GGGWGSCGEPNAEVAFTSTPAFSPRSPPPPPPPRAPAARCSPPGRSSRNRGGDGRSTSSHTGRAAGRSRPRPARRSRDPHRGARREPHPPRLRGDDVHVEG